MNRHKPTTYVSVISQALHQKWKLWGLPECFFDLKKKRRLQYTQYYGDGDSKAFMSVKDTYGLNSVTKFECIGHVQKRVGSRLRKLKTKTKALSGKSKLIDNFIDRLQNYYGIAVRSNVGNLTAMQQNGRADIHFEWSPPFLSRLDKGVESHLRIVIRVIEIRGLGLSHPILEIKIVRVHYFVRGGFAGNRSRASSKHLSPHLPVGELDSSGGQTGVALHLKLHVWASGLQRNRPAVDVFEK
ncbi:uncharacterized protein TNCV_4645761 [Trichonephila clavipes]|nr:uncharacterized protein TNCV_4645761 [Trichonephila clavipes]